MGVDLETYFWPSPEQDLNSRPLRTDPGGQSPHRHHCVAVFAVLYMAEMLPLL